jgi:hypothetical protein
MKRFLTLASVVLALTLVTGTAHAKGVKGNKADKGDKSAKHDPNSVVGKVQKVDGNTLTLLQGHGKKAGEVTITTDASTQIRVNGQDGKLADIKPGMRVVASPNTGTATKVVAMTPKKDKAAAGPTPDKGDAK